MDKPRPSIRYLSWRSASRSRTVCVWAIRSRAIARLPGRDPGTVSREVERNRNRVRRLRSLYRAQQKAAMAFQTRSQPRKAAEGTRLWTRSPPGCAGIGARADSQPAEADFRIMGTMHASVETIYRAIYLQAGRTPAGAERGAMRRKEPPRPQGGQGRRPFRTHGRHLERPRRSRTGRSRATGRAISSPAAATKRHPARSSSAPRVHDPAAPARRARR